MLQQQRDYIYCIIYPFIHLGPEGVGYNPGAAKQALGDPSHVSVRDSMIKKKKKNPQIAKCHP